jgi:hypothetical protein
MDQIREWRIPKSRVLRVFKDNCNRKGRGSMKPFHGCEPTLPNRPGGSDKLGQTCRGQAY